MIEMVPICWLDKFSQDVWRNELSAPVTPLEQG